MSCVMVVMKGVGYDGIYVCVIRMRSAGGSSTSVVIDGSRRERVGGNREELLHYTPNLLLLLLMALLTLWHSLHAFIHPPPPSLNPLLDSLSCTIRARPKQSNLISIVVFGSHGSISCFREALLAR